MIATKGLKSADVDNSRVRNRALATETGLAGHDNIADIQRRTYSMSVDYLALIWTALFAIGWLLVSAAMLQAVWTGKFPFMQKRMTGKKWPPIRAENPVSFWLTWSALAWPFLFLPLLVAAGWSNPG